MRVVREVIASGLSRGKETKGMLVGHVGVYRTGFTMTNVIESLS